MQRGCDSAVVNHDRQPQGVDCFERARFQRVSSCIWVLQTLGCTIGRLICGPSTAPTRVYGRFCPFEPRTEAAASVARYARDGTCTSTTAHIEVGLRPGRGRSRGGRQSGLVSTSFWRGLLLSGTKWRAACVRAMECPRKRRAGRRRSEGRSVGHRMQVCHRTSAVMMQRPLGFG